MSIDGRETRVDIQQTATDVDQVEHLSSPNRVDARYTSSTTHTGNHLRQNLRRWLSPPDPSTNHNIACRAHHKGTATWFVQGSIYNKWKSTPALLWVHGKRAPLSHFLLTPPDGILCVAGAGKSILWFVALLLFPSNMADVVYHLPVLQSLKISKSCAMPVKPRWLISISTSGILANKTGVT